MATAITVLYPNVEDATFDLDYYMTKHMPLVAERFASHGFKGWRVTRFIGTPQGGKAIYSVMATLEFDHADQFRAAIAAEGGVVLGDVPNFSNKEPVIMIGDIVGHT